MVDVVGDAVNVGAGVSSLAAVEGDIVTALEAAPAVKENAGLGVVEAVPAVIGAAIDLA